jgi:hypothetical protein
MNKTVHNYVKKYKTKWDEEWFARNQPRLSEERAKECVGYIDGSYGAVIQDLFCEIDALQVLNERLEQEKLDILAELYLESTSMAARIAKVCDEGLDKSGALLGRVRQRAKELSQPTLSNAQKPGVVPEPNDGISVDIPDLSS